MKTSLSIIFLCLFFTATGAQNLKIGFRFEPAFLFTEESGSASTSFTPYSMYLTTVFTPIEKLSLEIRPGYCLGGENYGGFEIGAFIRWMVLNSKFYLIGGINNHSNRILDSHNGVSGYSKNILYRGIGLGFQKDSKLSFDISYYWTDDQAYAYSKNNVTGIKSDIK